MNMRNEYLSLINNFSEINVTDTPNFVVMKAFYASLTNSKEFQPSEVCRIIANCTIEVDDSFINDKELLNRTVEVYTNFYIKLKREINSINPELFQLVVDKRPTNIKYQS